MTQSPQAGELAPDFTLPDEQGQAVRLSDFRGRRVVIYFYPKDDTTGCTAQACGFRDAYPEIEAQNAVVLGVSPDSAASHQKFKTKYNLPFQLLVDADHAVADQYGVWGEKTLYGVKFVGIIRSHFVVGPDGRVEAAHVKVSAKDSVAEARQALQAGPGAA